MSVPTHIALRNQWQIPRELATQVAYRDMVCIYCGNEFAPLGPFNRRRASWEHIVNDLTFITPENIAVCCVGCNASKGSKSLLIWLRSAYCAKHNINQASLAPVALDAALRELTAAITKSEQLDAKQADATAKVLQAEREQLTEADRATAMLVQGDAEQRR